MDPTQFIAPCEGFERVSHLQSGAFGMAFLERDIATGEQVAIKYLPRGAAITVNVQRETISHRLLRHPNVIAFKKALCTATHLASASRPRREGGRNAARGRSRVPRTSRARGRLSPVVMEFAAGGELFTRIASSTAQRFGESQARFFFMQLLAGVGYVHSQSMAHRDLKLEARAPCWRSFG